MFRQVIVLCLLLLSASQVFAQDAWPQFRGTHASGVSDQQGIPLEWDVPSGKHIAWKVAIPGLSHACPIIWKDRVYIVTAVSSKGDHDFKHGLYGAGTASEDLSTQRWEVHAYDATKGDLIWKSLAHEGPPQSKRHIKATYANSTPATNGEVIVAVFGSEGAFGFDLDGKKLWHTSLGDLNVGAYNAPDYEWGHASSPVIYGNRAYIQCDTSEDDFLLALDLKTGEEVWRTKRDELPSWGTPTILPGNPAEVLTNGSKFIMGYDAATGAELWRLGGSSMITAPTPIFSKDYVVVASGRRPVKPIFVMRKGVRGDLTLPKGQTQSDAIVWSSTGRGPYMPTPIIVGDLLFSITNAGVLDCYELATGKEIYRERIAHGGGGFSASPVATKDYLFLPSEDGEIFVVEAKRNFKLLATNAMDELLMATPALANNKLFVRGHKHLFAIGK